MGVSDHSARRGVIAFVGTYVRGQVSGNILQLSRHTLWHFWQVQTKRFFFRTLDKHHLYSKHVRGQVSGTILQLSRHAQWHFWQVQTKRFFFRTLDKHHLYSKQEY
jgi:hypothetical protein